MNLRAKSLILLSLAVAILVGISYASSRMLLTSGFARIEDASVRENVERAHRTLLAEVESLETMATDWANWDDSYAFVQDLNDNYRERNVVDSIFVDIPLDILLFFNPDGRLVFGRQFQREEGVQREPEDLLMSALAPNGLLHPVYRQSAGRSGLTLTALGPLAVSAFPILPSDKKGEPRGTIMMGRFLTSETIDRLARQAFLRLAIFPMDSDRPPADAPSSVLWRNQPDLVLVRPLNERYITGWKAIPDVMGRPAMLLRIEGERTIHHRAGETARWLVLVFLATGVFGGLTALWLQEKFVLSRLDRLSRSVEDVARRADLRGRVQFHGDDDLTRLAEKINGMLDAIERTEHRVKEQEARFTDSIENSGLVVIGVNRAGVIELFNQEAEKASGYKASDVFGRPYHFLLDGIAQPDARAERLAALLPESRVDSDIEVDWRTPEGRTVSLVWNVIPLTTGEGKPGGWLIFGRDVTEKKRIDRELTQARNHLQSIIDSMPSALVGVDRLGRVTEWNAAAVHLTGLDGGRALGRPWAQVLPWLEPLAGEVGKCIETREHRRMERFWSFMGGTHRCFDVMAYPLSGSDEANVVLRFDDVTARVHLEEIMVQTEKMMSLGGLAAGMAHEINNPLGGIIQGAQNIFRRLSPELAANREEAQARGITLDDLRAYLQNRQVFRFLEGILESGQRAARIVANMLEFSRRADSTKRPVVLSDLMEKTLELAASDYDLKKQFDFRHIEIIREYREDLGPVPCEPTKIEQVLFNLLKNAAQALAEKPSGEPGPRLTLRLAREGNWARIEVEDNGAGIPPEVRKRIFEPFFTTKPVGIGTGLGLSVSYFIIAETHGGSLEVESTPGQGARFIIRLPLKPEPVQPLAPIPDQCPEGRQP